MSAPLGVILAGGLATRMGGGDKALLQIGGQTLLQRVIDRLQPQVAGMALNANGDPARFDGFGLAVLPDSIDDFPGPLAGVLAGLDWAAEQGAEAIVTVAADTPFFPVDLVDVLQDTAQGMTHPLVLAATPRGEEKTKSMSRSGLIRHPTFGLWPVALRDDLRGALHDGIKKVVIWTEKHGGREAVFETDNGDPFFNVNTPEDLDAAEAMV
ncbi:molybdenum cofactor guanylyltransferase MobA [Marivita sp.]|jgi:molybdopterin-guanine dinucleotide biosynthesis protein A|uniref:molybdenum cofactor guanylyltransferase MobA n=1 Tax=Marivita sp. TaxID=2003365 RepID=UPI003F6C562C